MPIADVTDDQILDEQEEQQPAVGPVWLPSVPQSKESPFKTPPRVGGPTEGKHELGYERWMQHWLPLTELRGPDPNYDYRAAYNAKAFPTFSNEDLKFSWPAQYSRTQQAPPQAPTGPTETRTIKVQTYGPPEQKSMFKPGIAKVTGGAGAEGAPPGRRLPNVTDVSDDQIFEEKPSLWNWAAALPKGVATGALEQAAAIPESHAIGSRALAYKEAEGGGGFQVAAGALPYATSNLQQQSLGELPDITRAKEMAQQQAQEEIKTPLEETPEMRIGAWIRSLAPTMHPDVAKSFAAQVAKVGGQAGTQLVSFALAPKGYKLLTGAALPMSAESAEMYRRAKDAGANEQVAVSAAEAAAPLGMFDMAGTLVLYTGLGKIGGPKVVQGFATKLSRLITKYPRTATGLLGAAEEMATEIPQGLLEDQIAWDYFKEKSDAWESAWKSGSVAGTAGFLLGALGAALKLKMSRMQKPTGVGAAPITETDFATPEVEITPETQAPPTEPSPTPPAGPPPVGQTPLSEDRAAWAKAAMPAQAYETGAWPQAEQVAGQPPTELPAAAEVGAPSEQSSAPPLLTPKEQGPTPESQVRSKIDATKAWHGTDLDMLEGILGEGLREGSALDLTPKQEWAKESPIRVKVKGAKKGEYVPHNNYYKSKGVGQVTEVVVDLDAYDDAGSEKALEEVARLKEKHPKVKFRVIGEGPRADAITPKNIAEFYKKEHGLSEEEATQIAREDYERDIATGDVKRVYGYTGPMRTMQDYAEYQQWLVQQGEEYDASQKREGIPGEVGVGQEPVQARALEEASREAAAPSGVLQAPEQRQVAAAVPTPKPVVDDRLQRTYKTRLSAGRDAGALNAEYPGRQFEVRSSGKEYVVREKTKRAPQLGVGRQEKIAAEPTPKLQEVKQAADTGLYKGGETRAITTQLGEDILTESDAKRTATAMLSQVAADVRSKDPAIREDVLDWLDDESNEPGSFKWIAEVLDQDADSVREAFKSGKADPEAIKDAVKLYTFNPFAAMGTIENLWQSRMINDLRTDKRIPASVMGDEFLSMMEGKVKKGEIKQEEWEDTKRMTGLTKWIKKWGNEPISMDVIIAEMESHGIEVEVNSYWGEGTKYGKSSHVLPGGEDQVELIFWSPVAAELNEDPVHFQEGTGRRQFARLRGNMRYDSDGSKVFFIEEAQSDRHARGSSAGYQDIEGYRYIEAYKAARNKEQALAEEYKVYEPFKKAIPSDEDLQEVNRRDQAMEQDPRWQEIQDELKTTYDAVEKYLGRKPKEEDFLSGLKPGVPDAPFRKSWLNLLSRAALRFMAENGIRKIAWATGEQHATRSNLREVAHKLRYHIPANAQGQDIPKGAVLYIVKPDGSQVGRNITPDRLAEYVGPVLAKQLLDRSKPLDPETNYRMALEARGRDITRYYNDGMLTEAEYEKDLAENQALIDNGVTEDEYYRSLPTKSDIYGNVYPDEKYPLAPYVIDVEQGWIDVPDPVSLYKAQWPEKVYGFEGRLEAPTRTAPLKPVGGYEVSKIGTALREATKPFKGRDISVASPAAYQDPLKEYSVQPGVEIPEEQVNFVRNTPIYLYTWNPLQWFRDMEKLPGGGGLRRLGKHYDRYAGLPNWWDQFYQHAGDFFHIHSKIANRWNKVTQDTLTLADSFFDLPDESRTKVAQIAQQIEGRKLRATPSQEISFTQQNTVATPNPQFYTELEAFLQGKGLTPEEIKAVVDLRKLYHKVFSIGFNALAKDPTVDRTTVENMYNHIGMIPNYLPHNWYGNHYIPGYDMHGELVARIPVEIGLLERGLGRAASINKLTRDWEAASGIRGLRWGEMEETKDLEKYYINTPISIEVIGRVFDEAMAALETIQGGQFKPSIEAMRKALPDEIRQIIRASGMQNLAKRRGMYGYEQQDIMRVTADYVAQMYGTLKKMEQAREFTKLMMARKPDATESGLLNSYFEDMMAPHEGRLDKAVGMAKQAMFLRYMWGRLSPGLLNLGNQITTGIPLLSMHAKGSGWSHTKALKDVMTQFKREVTKLGAKRIGIQGLPTDNVFSPEELTIIQNLQDDGTVQPQQVWEMSDKMRREFKARGPTRRLIELVIGKATELGSSPMEMTEWYSRVSTAIAAARSMANGQIVNLETLAKYGLAPGERPAMSDPRVEAFARDVALKSHGEYGTHNKPAFARAGKAGKIVQVPYTFRFFTHNLLEMWRAMLHNGPRGYMAFARSIAGQMLIGGLRGIPAIGTIAALYAAYTGDDPEEELRKILPGGEDMQDVIMYGLPAHGAGGLLPKMSLGGRIEVDLPESVQEMLFGVVSGTDIEPQRGIGEEMVGVAGSLARDVVMGWNAWAKGNPRRAAEYMAPVIVLRDLLKAERLQREGAYTIGGSPIIPPGAGEPTKLTAKEAWAQRFGVLPLKSDLEFRGRRRLGREEATRRSQMDRLASRFANAFKDKDDAAMERVLDEVQAWNMLQGSRNKPHMMLDIKDAVNARVEPHKIPKRLGGRAMELQETYSTGETAQ